MIGNGILAGGTTLLVIAGVISPWWLIGAVPWLAGELIVLWGAVVS